MKHAPAKRRWEIFQAPVLVMQRARSRRFDASDVHLYPHLGCNRCNARSGMHLNNWDVGARVGCLASG